MKFCKDCKHFAHAIHHPTIGVCLKLPLKAADDKFITYLMDGKGDLTCRYQYASLNRFPESACGTEGKLFEPKEEIVATKNPSWFSRLIRIFK